MPKIPLAEGREQIIRQPLAPRQGPGIFSAEVARASQELARTAANVARQFEEAQTLAEKTKADTEASRRLRELELEAETTENIWNIQEFKNKIGKVREDANKLITLPQAKNEFSRAFDRSALVSEFSIRKTLRTRQVDATITEINENLTAQREAFITGDANTRQIAETKRNVLLADAVSRGIIKADSARDSREKMIREWRLAKIDYDIENDAEFALEQLLLGEEGIYADVDAKDRLPKQASANQKINRDKAIANRNIEIKQEEAESAVGLGILNGEITELAVNEAELKGTLGLEGGISTSFATVARRAVKSVAAVTAKTKGDVFNRLQNEFVALGIKVKTRKGVKKFSTQANVRDIAKFRANVIDAYNAGDIEPAVGRNWLTAVSNVFEKALSKEAKKTFKEDLETGKIDTIQNLWGKLSFWSDEFAADKEEVKARLGQELMGRLINTNQDGNDIVDELIEKEQKESNPNRALYKIGQVINTPSGTWKVVDFDGDGEPILELVK